jgi:predicted permease
MPSITLALRSLVRTPFVSAIAILSLALGIGANAGVFSAFDQVLLRPLPVSEPDRLVNLAAPGPKPGSQNCNQSGNCDVVFSYPMFRDLERIQNVFTGIAAHRILSVNVTYRRQTLNAEGLIVSGSYFPVLGLTPALGRLLGPDDDRVLDESPVAVLSHDFWQTRFGGDPSVLNDTMLVNGQSMTIVGVAPRGFVGTTFGARTKIFVPITMYHRLRPRFDAYNNRRSYWAYLFARLKPGVSIEQARAAINVQYHNIVNDVEAPLQNGMSDKTMARFRSKTVMMEPGPRGQSNVHRAARVPLILLMSVTALVVLIACANIANLLLARGAARAAEMATRLSLGASRWQLISQLMGEAGLLALLGGAAGLLVARWTLQLTMSLLPAEVALAFSLALDARVVCFTTVLSMLTGLLFGLFPALQATRPDLIALVKNQSAQPSGGRTAARFRSSLVVAQVALSLSLLFAAGVFVRSLVKVSQIDLGVDTKNLVTFRVSPGLNGYDAARSIDTYNRIQAELSAIPGVSLVTTAVVPILADNSWGNDVSVERFQAGPDTDTNSRFNAVGPAYLRTMGMSLIAGREFERRDASGAPKVAIVNEAFAKKFNLGRNAVGKRMAVGNNKTDLDIEIVGLAKDAAYSDAKDGVPPLYFIPHLQDTYAEGRVFYLRSTLEASRILSVVPKAVARVDPNLPVQDLLTMEQQARESVFMDRMISTLSSLFAGLATLLAAVGLYGVLAYAVTQRTREIGLRMAIGAAPLTIRGMVLAQVGRLTAAGVVIGLATALALGRGARSLLYEVQSYDPVTALTATAVLGAVALCAGLVPALRAARVDPIKALRDE